MTLLVVSVSITLLVMVYVTFLLEFVLVLVNVRLLANFVVLGGTLVLVLGRVESVAHYKERSIHS